MHINIKFFFINTILILVLFAVLFGAMSCNKDKPIENPEPTDTAQTTTEPTESTSPEYYTYTPEEIAQLTRQAVPYGHENDATEELKKLLRDKGYYGREYHEDGTSEIALRTDYNYENIKKAYEVTSKNIEENSDIKIYMVDGSGAYFFLIDGELWRNDSFGGYHHAICFWDYDGNGVKDIVLYSSFGSGVSYLGCTVWDMVTKDFHRIKVVMFSSFKFGFDGENIYIDDVKVEYKDNKFNVSPEIYTEPYVTAPVSDIPNNTKEDVEKARALLKEKFSSFAEVPDDLIQVSALSAGNNTIYTFVYTMGGIPAGRAWQYEMNVGATEPKLTQRQDNFEDFYLTKRFAQNQMNQFKSSIVSQIADKIKEYEKDGRTIIRPLDTKEYYDCLYWTINENNKLTLSCEYIAKYQDAPSDNAGCGIDHEHIFASVQVEN